LLNVLVGRMAAVDEKIAHSSDDNNKKLSKIRGNVFAILRMGDKNYGLK